MNLDEARNATAAALARMNAAYQETVFDEWVLVSLKPERGAILAYTGPRPESYKKAFAADVQPLRNEIAEQKLAVGDFVFVSAAKGTRHDACMRIGPSGFLFCNHTGKSIDEIRENPLWRAAQKPFVELSDKFRADPVE